MSRLKQIKAQQKQVRTPKKEHKKQTGLPVYNSRGKNITPSRKQKQKKLGITLIICSGIFAFIYLPQYFYVPTAQTVNVSTDITAIRKANTVLREDPSGDYDGDGLSNADEETNGTDNCMRDILWHVDYGSRSIKRCVWSLIGNDSSIFRTSHSDINRKCYSWVFTDDDVVYWRFSSSWRDWISTETIISV